MENKALQAGMSADNFRGWEILSEMWIFGFWITIASLWRENMHRLLSANMICTKMRKVFPRTKLKENCELRETFTAQGQLAAHICAQTEATVFITLHIFWNTCKNGYKQLTVCSVGYFLLSVFCYDLMNKKDNFLL